MKRRGFTLVELLVGIAIMIVLMAFVLAYYSKRESSAPSDAATHLESYLAGAKTRALRENRPIGVRLISTDNGRTFASVQLIEQPPPFAPINPGSISNPNSPLTIYLDLPVGNKIQADNNNANPTIVGNTARQVGVPLQGNVEVGDFLEIVETTPSIHRITAINYATNTMTLESRKEAITDPQTGAILYWFTHGVPNVNTTGAAQLRNNYRYIRKTRPLLGEQAHQLPKDVMIRGATGVIPTSLSIPLSQNGEYEIIFAPSGQVLNATGGRIVLWIADTNNVGKPRLVCVYTANGAIVGHPVGPAGNEFSFTQDGRASGQ